MSTVFTRSALDVIVGVGHTPIALLTRDVSYARVLQQRFAGFVSGESDPALRFDLELITPSSVDPDDDVRVSGSGDRWRIERSDFEAEVDLASRTGWVRQVAHPYATDTLIRIVHTLLLARSGGFLLHASSGIRNGRAYVFFGRSGAGKSTMAGLAPADVTLLTDEVSYVRRDGNGYVAHGTPFTGELGKMGDNISAPIAGLFHLVQGHENRIEPMTPATAVNALLESVLFFTNDANLVKDVFESACDLVSRVPVRSLVFRPDQRVWELMK